MRKPEMKIVISIGIYTVFGWEINLTQITKSKVRET